MKDRPAVAAEIWIDAAPEAVWPLVTDVARMGEWSPENEGGRWQSDPGGLGATFESTNRRGEREWTTISTVVGWIPNEVFAFAVNDPANPAAIWTYLLTPEESGTRVVERVRLGPGPSGLTSWIDRHPDQEAEGIHNRMADLWGQMMTTLEGIKAAAEQ